MEVDTGRFPPVRSAPGSPPALRPYPPRERLTSAKRVLGTEFHSLGLTQLKDNKKSVAASPLDDEDDDAKRPHPPRARHLAWGHQRAY